MSIANAVPPNKLESGERVGDRLHGNFKGLVSVSLCNSVTLSTEELTLPHFEPLHISRNLGAPPLPTQEWNLPRLRYMHFDGYCTPTDIDDLFDYLLRYVFQLETLVLDT
jgi:hypothetical protein